MTLPAPLRLLVSMTRLAAALAFVLAATPAPAQDHDLEPLGQDTPQTVRCGDVGFQLSPTGALRFQAWHFRSTEPVGPENSTILCGQYMGADGTPVGWICATEAYTPVGVSSATHMCEAVDKLLSGEH